MVSKRLYGNYLSYEQFKFFKDSKSDLLVEIWKS